MNPRRMALAGLLLAGLLLGFWPGDASQAGAPSPAARITGTIFDAQEQPVEGAQVWVQAGAAAPLAETSTQPDGSFALALPENLPQILSFHVERTHFDELALTLEAAQVQRLTDGETITLPNITLERRVGAGFWVAAIVFVVVLALIATDKLHNTLATLLGVAILFGVSYLGHPFWEGLYIFDFTARCATWIGTCSF